MSNMQFTKAHRFAALAVLGAITLITLTQAQVGGIEKNPNTTIRSLSDPVRILTERVNTLEKRIEKLEADNKALKEAVTPVPQAVERANFLYSEFLRPGGQQGVTRKVYQKSTWNRIPDSAYVIVYQR